MSEKEKFTHRGTLPRRDALKLVVVGAAGAPLAGLAAETEGTPPTRPPTDPDLVNPTVPWPKVMSDSELATAAALCDIILPADEHSPAASAAGVHEFIDEWISAPYPNQQHDKGVVRGGLAWLNTESVKRHGRPFAALEDAQKTALCEAIHDESKAAPEHRQAARFFDTFRRLTIGGFYTTEAGRKDLGYLGNKALDRFTGATPEQLRHLGLV